MNKAKSQEHPDTIVCLHAHIKLVEEQLNLLLSPPTEPTEASTGTFNCVAYTFNARCEEESKLYT